MDNNKKFKKSQILKLFVIITLLGITPVVSESLRTPYLYFVVNLLIIALGAEAGLLSFIFKVAVEKSQSEKIVKVKKKAAAEAVKKSPSIPSLFFIGGGDQELVEQQEELEEVDHHEELTDQELFHKAEIFIGNFYKQLKMQREESWKKIHGLYQEAF